MKPRCSTAIPSWGRNGAGAVPLAACAAFALLADAAHARAPQVRYEISEPTVDVDAVGDVDGARAPVSKPAVDTLWIANWTFETGAVCDMSGWEKVDGYVLNDGVTYWNVDPAFDGVGGIAGNAAALGYANDLCCEEPNGYDNDWYQAIRIEYDDTALSVLSFDYMLDSERGFDFLQVEADFACSSFARVDLAVDPTKPASAYRQRLYSDSGDVTSGGSVEELVLSAFGAGTSCVYIAFFADGGFSPCDGLQPSLTGRALVVDNIALSENGVVTTEDFSDGTLSHGWTFANIQESTQFGPTLPGRNGSWARTYAHVTDNEACVENTTCAILWTDDTTPTIANDPSMAFGPGGYVVRSWLDDRIVSPWVSLVGLPPNETTIIRFRRFPGNFFSGARMTQNWSVRSRFEKDDGMGGTVSCVSDWAHAAQFNTLSLFQWIVPTAGGLPPGSGYDMSVDIVPGATEIQVRHRTLDRQVISTPPPGSLLPGPGPYIDDTRIGRVPLTGPVLDEGIDARSQAQDAFATEIHTGVTPGTGEHHRPMTSRFGTAAFSRGADLAIAGTSANLITGDSITVRVEDVRGAGGVTRVEMWARIVSGVHNGLAPPPYAVGSHGFFVVPADSVRRASGAIVAGEFFVDLDDEYFVGGDVLHYVWLAEDALGGVGSVPRGLTSDPTSAAEAEAATQGLFEVSFLPNVHWDVDYIGAVIADNKVDPLSDPTFLDDTAQQSCILYVNRSNFRRRSGDIHRTSFMYTLDRLGYRGIYDIYDHSGMGNTNNHLGGRARVEQAQGYALIVYDTGNSGPGGTLMPDGLDLDTEKVDQASWFRSWLAQAPVSEIGVATLWLIGSNLLEEKPTNALYSTDMQVSLLAASQSSSRNPDCQAVSSFGFETVSGTSVVDFTSGPSSNFSLQGGCPTLRSYDALDPVGSGVAVFRYADHIGSPDDAAIVMNANAPGRWNTILQSHPWFDIRNPQHQTPGSPEPEEDLLQQVLNTVQPVSCGFGEPSGTDPAQSLPRVTVLHANAPNPFNPTTTIRFDLAHDGHVTLRIYDVAGRLVRTLVDEDLRAASAIERVWDGLDDDGVRAPTGVYLYRLDAPRSTSTRKMLLLQ